MYQEKKRERRRRDYLRMKERARKVQAKWWDTSTTDPDLDRVSSKLANNIRICSCNICGNPRRHYNIGTKQEISAYLRDKDMIEEAGIRVKMSRSAKLKW